MNHACHSPFRKYAAGEYPSSWHVRVGLDLPCFDKRVRRQLYRCRQDPCKDYVPDLTIAFTFLQSGDFAGFDTSSTIRILSFEDLTFRSCLSALFPHSIFFMPYNITLTRITEIFLLFRFTVGIMELFFDKTHLLTWRNLNHYFIKDFIGNSLPSGSSSHALDCITMNPNSSK